jgi:hypothetical protein
MITGRNRDYASLFLVIGQRENFVGRAANLEGAGTLEVFTFEENFAPGNLVERVRSHDGRPVYASRQPLLGLSNEI